jgi:hypothetical protein
MNTNLTVEYRVHVRRRQKGRVELADGPPPRPLPEGRVPRVSRLLALAHRFDALIREGEVADQADLARRGGVTRARLTQVMNLLLLAPDIQEEVLHLPRVAKGRDPVQLRHLQPVALTASWPAQRRLWKALVA